MLLLPGEATVLTYKDREEERPRVDGWKLMTFEVLVADIEEMIKTKSTGQTIFYGILLLLAMLAIFDTQILSIFRRQKEIGTYIALFGYLLLKGQCTQYWRRLLLLYMECLCCCGFLIPVSHCRSIRLNTVLPLLM
jgi:hypothetical protein